MVCNSAMTIVLDIVYCLEFFLKHFRNRINFRHPV
jgi:hypothetical protein